MVHLSLPSISGRFTQIGNRPPIRMASGSRVHCGVCAGYHSVRGSRQCAFAHAFERTGHASPIRTVSRDEYFLMPGTSGTSGHVGTKAGVDVTVGYPALGPCPPGTVPVGPLNVSRGTIVGRCDKDRIDRGHACRPCLVGSARQQRPLPGGGVPGIALEAWGWQRGRKPRAFVRGSWCSPGRNECHESLASS